MIMNMRRGFTLVELLVVIAIISVLAALLLPVLHKARNMALTADCINRLRQLGLAGQLYGDDWGGRFPIGPKDDYGYDPIWPHSMTPYLPSDPCPRPNTNPELVPQAMGYCPAYDFRNDWRGNQPTNDARNLGKYASLLYHQVLSYTQNYFLIGKGWRPDVVRFGQVASPSSAILWGEGWHNQHTDGPGGFYYNPNHNNRAPILYADVSARAKEYYDIPTGVIAHAVNPPIKSATMMTWIIYAHPEVEINEVK